MDGTFDHVMIRVEDLDESLDWYQTHLNYEEKGRWEADTFTNVFLGPEDVHEDGALLELTYNHDGRSYEIGDAWGHIAVRVPEDALQESYDQLMDEGVEDYRDPESCGNRYAFVKDPDGHEIEIVKRDHGAKWSIDHTMVRVEDPPAGGAVRASGGRRCPGRSGRSRWGARPAGSGGAPPGAIQP